MKNRILVIVAVLLGLVSILRLFYYIDVYAVNLLYWDQWSFYDAFFEEHSVWEIFSFQHGTHRQGIGFLITRWLDLNSGWNTRVTCFAIGVFLTLAAFGYLILKQRLFKSLKPIDAAIFILALTPAQYALFTNVPNLSHGAMTAFLLTAYCFVLTVHSTYIKSGLLILINFFLVYSAFGLFMGIITPAVFLIMSIKAFQNKQNKAIYFHVVMLVLSMLTMLLFLSDYDFSALQDSESSKPLPIYDYLLFIGISYVNFGLADVRLGLLGLVFVAFILYVFIVNVIRLLKSATAQNKPLNELNLVIVILIAFSLLFISSSAIGRLPMGMHQAHASRYIPYLIPSMVGVYFFLFNSNMRHKKWVLGVFALGIIISTVPRKDMKRISAMKDVWKSSYLKHENIQKANQESGLSIYPNPEAVDLKKKMQYLESNHLNLFLEAEE